MDKKNQLLDLVAKSQQSELTFISDLSDEERALAGTSQEWSAKDEIVHIAAWKDTTSHRFMAAMGKQDPPTYDDLDAANEEIFQRYRLEGWDFIVRFHEKAYRHLVEQIGLIAEDILVDTELFDWLGGRSLWNRAVHTAYFHPLWHIALRYSQRGDGQQGNELMEEVTRNLLSLDEAAYWQAQSLYNLACYYALSGEKEKSIENLSQAFSLSSDMVEWSKTDPDLVSIWDDPSYRALLAKQED